MREIMRLMRRMRYLMRGWRLEAELAEEMEFHRDMAQQAMQEGGAAVPDAVDSARRTMGGTLAARDAARDVWIWPWLQSLLQDVRFAARLLAKDRGFTIVALLALALGFGVNNTMFTVVNALCIRGLPLDRPERFVALGTRDARETDQGLSFADLQDAGPAARSLAATAAYAGAAVAVGDPGRAPDRAWVNYVSWNAFRLIGEAPRLGRDFRADDDRPGAPAIVILGAGLWKSRYGSDTAIVGRTISVRGVPSTVIGVMPDGFKFPNNADLWQPLALMPGLANQRRDARTLSVFARLNDEATLPQAQAELTTIGARLARDHPDTNTGIRLTAVTLNDRFNSPITNPAWIAFMTVGALLVLVACANVANLLLMRSTTRTREIAIRASLGATRARVVRQLLVESVLLAALGGLLGFGLSLAGVRIMANAIPAGGLPYWVTFTMDARVIAMLAIVCLATVVLFGVAPALHVSKTDVNGVLKDAGRGVSGGLRARRWTALFLTAEFAITMILLAGVFTTIRGFRAAEKADIVIDRTNLLTMWVALANERYQDREKRVEFFARLDERLGAMAAASSATVTSALPFGGASPRQLAIDGRAEATNQLAPPVWTLSVGTRYFETLRLQMLRGRAFTARDGLPGQETAIINERFAQQYFPNEDAIGRRIQLTARAGASSAARAPGAGAAAAAAAPWLTIVGISPSVRQHGMSTPQSVVYLPYRADPAPTAALIVRTSSDPTAIAALLREEVRALDPDLPLYRVMTMEQVAHEAGWNPRVGGGLLMVIAFIAFGLSAVGLYAVTAHAAAQRTQEIGVRIALGARSPQVVWLVLRRGLIQLAIGLIVGVISVYVYDRSFGGGRPGANSMTDAEILIPVVLLLSVMTLAACVSPARRATRLDPVIALRGD